MLKNFVVKSAITIGKICYISQYLFHCSLSVSVVGNAFLDKMVYLADLKL